MTLYILKSAIILGILLAVYQLFLEREKMHKFNRFYLIAGLVLALATPFISIGTINTVTPSSILSVAPSVISEVQTNIIYETSKGIEWTTFIMGSYILISFILFLRFVNNIGSLLFKYYQNPCIEKDGYRLVLSEDIIHPFTFLRNVFVNSAQYESGDIEPEILLHESTHARQLHTLDIILIELTQVFLWFNPLIYLYKKAIQLNHEFLADEAVINSTQSVMAYQYLLLEKSSPLDYIPLTSNINFSVTKKRILMMTKPISRWRNVIYGLMVIPICILLVSCFGDYEILNPHPLIQSNGDIIAVDIRKMNPDQIELARAKLKQFNIDLTVKNIKYDGNEFMTNLTVHADFNNGNTAKESFNSTCTGGIQFPYGIWKNLETGESGIGWPVDFEVSNQSADSPSSRPIADSYIDYISQDKFSVNFKGMTSEQVDAVQKEVEGKGISLFYNKLGFNTAGLINMIQFTFEMGRGNSRSATFAFSQSQLNNSPPFGFWINKKAGTSGTGTLSIEGNITKAILYDNVSLEQYKGASFFIEDKQVSFKEVKGWLEEHNWISNTISYEPSNKVYRFTLPDSSN